MSTGQLRGRSPLRSYLSWCLFVIFFETAALHLLLGRTTEGIFATFELALFWPPRFAGLALLGAMGLLWLTWMAVPGGLAYLLVALGTTAWMFGALLSAALRTT